MATILIVEDDRPLRMVIEIALRTAGHRVISAPNGIEAAALLGPKGSLDLVITDVFMPEMDGFEVMKAIRKHDPNVRILVISGGGRPPYPDFLQLATQLGADRALAKPFTPERLLATVDEVLAAASPGESGATPGKRGAGTTVLVVEDDTLMRSTIRTILEEDGYAILEAGDGLEAMKVLRSPPPGRAVPLIVTDILMPKVDGMSLISNVQKLDRSIKILAISGGSRAIFSNILAAAVTYGAHDSLKKPFTAQQLRDKVGRLLQS